jgi:D-beta-D-heptose 7-phosphate kinase/D-beta-D-heptose 1-phosphate adenosyltransferase
VRSTTPESAFVISAIPDFASHCILVAGDAMLDEYWFGDAQRISPEAPVPVVRRHDTQSRAGGAANVAANLAALGVKTTLAAIVGNDAPGQAIREALHDAGIDPVLTIANGCRTAHKLRVLARQQQLIRLDAEESLAGAAPEFAKAFEGCLANAEIVVLSDYAKGTLANVSELISACRAAAVKVLVDPKGVDFEKYRGASVLTPNQSEFLAVAGPCPDEEQFLARGRAMCVGLELDALLVTRGAQGMTLFCGDSDPVTLPAHTREVFDVTGAGDTVIATMAASLAAGTSLEDAARLANLAAGIVIAKIGVATVTRAELRFALHRRGRGGGGVVDLDSLIDIVAEARGRGNRIVFTNGCFDILHAGHVAYLEEAKALGDYLVVAVNDDDSVRRLKGATRPIVGIEDRMAVLAGLAAVDWVVPFADDTPLALIEALLPDILVKGGDWSPEQIVGNDVVLRSGGQVHSLQFRPGRSTTSIVETIKRA